MPKKSRSEIKRETSMKGGSMDTAFDIIQLQDRSYFRRLSRAEELKAWDVVMAPLDAPLTMDTLCLVSMAYGNAVARLEWIIKHRALVTDTGRKGSDRFFVTTEDAGCCSAATYDEAIDKARDADR